MIDFEIAYKITAGNEGGYVVEDGDTGGETYCGISRVNNPKWIGWQIVDKQKPLKKGQIINDPVLHGLVKTFYKKNYWEPLKPEKLSSQDLANQVYDHAVNAGVRAAKKMLKAIGIALMLIMFALGVNAQSKQKPRNAQAYEGLTIGRITAERDSLLALTQAQAARLYRVKFYADICNRKPSQRKFLLGWINRALNEKIK